MTIREVAEMSGAHECQSAKSPDAPRMIVEGKAIALTSYDQRADDAWREACSLENGDFAREMAECDHVAPHAHVVDAEWDRREVRKRGFSAPFRQKMTLGCVIPTGGRGCCMRSRCGSSPKQGSTRQRCAPKAGSLS